MSNATLAIDRDFSYTDPRGIVLYVIRRGVKERWVYPDIPTAHAAHAELRAGEYEYLPTNVGRSHWAGADVKHSTGKRAEEMGA